MTTTEERFEPGADVISSDGEKVGTVVYVVVKPPEIHVTNIVVSTGAIIGRDILVDVGSVSRVEGGKVYLSIPKDKVTACPDYVEVNFEQPPLEWAPEGPIFFPTQSILWPVGVNYRQATSLKVNAPEGTVGLHEGMEVDSSDGHKIGKVHAIDVDSASGNVTDIVIEHGLLSKQRFRIAASEIAEIHADRVTLKLTKADVEKLQPKT
jgi:sporulation protein YlmC with PRC-barrel domain